jgi:hypothetical protein
VFSRDLTSCSSSLRALSRRGILFALACATPSVAAAAVLERIEVLDARHATALHLHLDGGFVPAETELLANPPRLLVVLPGVRDASATPLLQLDGRHARSVEVVPRDGGIAVVIEAGSAVEPFHQHGVSATDDGVLVVVGVDPGSGATPVVPASDPAGAAAAQAGGASAAVLAAAAASPASSTPAGAEPIRADGLQFRVGRLDLRYAQPHPEAPPIAVFQELEVELGVTGQGYVAPRQGVPSTRLFLSEIPSDPLQIFYGSAIRSINERIVAEFTRRGVAGVLVVPDDRDVDPSSGRDLRPPGQSELHLVIWLGRLLEFRTFASGERIAEAERIDSPVHQRIKQQSPLQPGDLLRKDDLDAYLARLNRHPGRSVDVTLSAATEPGGVYLDYLVAEGRPYQFYAQVSNTGTRQTTDWRQRFGFQHTQVTNRDDIAKLDYITGDFDTPHAVFGSYDSPIGPWPRLRGRIGGNWAKYDASDFAVVEQLFDGEQWGVSGQLVFNVWQREEFFADVFAGLRYQDVEATNEPFPGDVTDAETQFFFPEFGLVLERETEESIFRLATSFEFNADGVAGTEAEDLLEFGRFDVEETEFKILRWDLFGSVYLEPLLNREGYLDPDTAWDSALAHELQLAFRGQHSFDDRLIPQLQRVAGGLFSVRGYREATSAGDSALLGRFEYRFHLPRVLPIQPTPARLPVIGDFRVAPTQVYGRPDWDLILRTFVDAGRTIQAKRVPGENNETLVSTGLGLELQVFKLRFLSNLTLSFDWGHALRDARLDTTNEVEAGDDRFHFLATIVR